MRTCTNNETARMNAHANNETARMNMPMFSPNLTTCFPRIISQACSALPPRRSYHCHIARAGVRLGRKRALQQCSRMSTTRHCAHSNATSHLAGASSARSRIEHLSKPRRLSEGKSSRHQAKQARSGWAYVALARGLDARGLSIACEDNRATQTQRTRTTGTRRVNAPWSWSGRRPAPATATAANKRALRGCPIRSPGWYPGSRRRRWSRPQCCRCRSCSE